MGKKGKGFLIWGGFLAFMTLYPLLYAPIKQYERITIQDSVGPRLIASASLEMKIVAIGGGLIAIIFSYFFFRIAQKRIQRKWYLSYFGYLLLAAGTFYIYFIPSMLASASFLEARGLDGYESFNTIRSVIIFIAAVLSTILSYLLIFRTKKQTLEFQNINMANIKAIEKNIALIKKTTMHDEKYKAVEHLVNIGDESIRYLSSLLSEKEPQIRGCAIIGIKQIFGTHRIFKELSIEEQKVVKKLQSFLEDFEIFISRQGETMLVAEAAFDTLECIDYIDYGGILESVQQALNNLKKSTNIFEKEKTNAIENYEEKLKKLKK